MCSEGAFLDAAVAIGRRIMRDAVWHGDRCSWVGAEIDTSRPWRATYRALGPTVYDGTAGVGLFLAELAAATGDVAARRTAVGTLRHAVSRARALPPDRRDGFHAGSLGVAWAGARAAARLDDEELLAAARTLWAATPPPSGPGRRPDVIPGTAGTLLAQLALADALDAPNLFEDAIATGEELIASGSVTRHGWCWRIPGPRRPLCGLSHGAAGIGWALLELFAATGDRRFGSAATGAFAWERSWFDERSGTWPDLRIGGQRRGAPRLADSPPAATWCHGEAGIALTRLRAAAVLASDVDRRDAELALRATHRRLVAALPSEIDDLTLCHGAAGAADVLLTGAALDPGRRDAAAVAHRLGYAALERHDQRGDGWPCAGGIRTTPELFGGLGGIGWWFLRLHDEAVPSPLTMPVRPLTAVRAEA
jgi:lantibiotic modifying enzyme